MCTLISWVIANQPETKRLSRLEEAFLEKRQFGTAPDDIKYVSRDLGMCVGEAVESVVKRLLQDLVLHCDLHLDEDTAEKCRQHNEYYAKH